MAFYNHFWLIVERDGIFTDYGFVEMKPALPVLKEGEPFDIRPLIRVLNGPQDLAATVRYERDEAVGEDAAPTLPLNVELYDGSRERWYIGAAARQLMIERGLFTPLP